MNLNKISRRNFLCAVGLTTAAALTACGSSASSAAASSAAASSGAAAEPVELIVFAAASLTETLTAIGETYSAENPGVTFRFNFDSSGTLKTQIEEGAPCDIFISAAQKQMNQLDSADSTGTNTDGLDFVYSDTRFDLVENKVVLAVPDDNPKDIQSFSDLASDKLSLLCIGNEDVPVGSYSLEILETLGIDIAQLDSAGKVTYGTNVSEVANQLKEGAVDCGIIYATDAYTYELTVVDEATEDLCGQVIYPAAVMKSGTEAGYGAAVDFLRYLHTDPEAVSILEGVGFTVLP